MPWLVTGAKAWHIRPGSIHYTRRNLDRALACLAGDRRGDRRRPAADSGGGVERHILIVSAGEIDAREGIGPAVRKGKYASLAEAVRVTLDGYAGTLRAVAREIDMDIVVLPVPPPALRGKKIGREGHREERTTIVKLMNERLRQLFGTTKLGTHRTAEIEQEKQEQEEQEQEEQQQQQQEQLVGGMHTTTITSPPAAGKSSVTARHGKCRRRVMLADYADKLYHKDGSSLHPRFDCDHTHLNANVLPLLQDALDGI